MLKEFFSPVSKLLLKGTDKNESLIGGGIAINTSKFPDTSNIDVALIGLGDNANNVRKYLYSYSNRLSGISVADLGNLKHTGTGKNINAGLAECFIALREKNIIPVVIGEQGNYAQALLKGIDFARIDYALVSPAIAWAAGDAGPLFNSKSRLFHASYIAYQTYLNTNITIQEAGDVFTESLRLGSIRADMSLAEPLLRQADIFDFDLSAIKYSEFSSASDPLPNGLLNHEACALCRYAGISNTVAYYLLRNFSLGNNSPVDSQQVAQMIWYILDGIDSRFNDFPQMSHRNFTVYKCHATNGIDMVFLNSNLTGRWWMQVPEKVKGKKTAPKFIGCNSSDFEIAREGDVPEKWFRAAGSGF
jgi:formiminoglutamase